MICRSKFVGPLLMTAVVWVTMSGPAAAQQTPAAPATPNKVPAKKGAASPAPGSTDATAPVPAQPQFVFSPWTKICSDERGKNACGIYRTRGLKPVRSLPPLRSLNPKRDRGDC